VEFYYCICEGEPYWKVEPFAAQSLSRQHQELAYLRFVEGQQYNSSGCRELVPDNVEVDDIPDSIRDSIIESYLDAAREPRPNDWPPKNKRHTSEKCVWCGGILPKSLPRRY